MWGSVALTAVAITSHSGVLYNSSAITVNFPVEVASVDTVNTDFANTGGAFAVLRVISLSSFNVYLYADASQAPSGTLAWSAKGKWK